jgi:small-conductance mechanosensitive channel
MAKTDFKRVEDALDEGLQRMTQNRLLDYSSIASQVGVGTDSLSHKRQQAAEVTLHQQQERKLLAAAVNFDINQLFKKNHQLYTALNTNHEEITALTKDITSLKEDQWQRLLEIKASIEDYKSKMPDTITDDDVIAKERIKHVNKRFNTRDHWLPLH